MAKTYLSSDFKLNGNIKSQGDIEIDGQIKGKVVGNSVAVLTSGNVDGSITGKSVSKNACKKLTTVPLRSANVTFSSTRSPSTW